MKHKKKAVKPVAKPEFPCPVLKPGVYRIEGDPTLYNFQPYLAGIKR